ncbi:MAG: NADP-dependent oxidoreductase [Gammaproteobacteria bacterium]|nr:NADP-dependent oxidoreductase [Gammaproteobacteria bacterium]|tara:strand:- start:686 stop:1687 length:1002 start_codon:yes stop_codon:yes gene_type:complete
MQSQEVRLKRRPVGMPDADDFEVVTVDLPDPEAGEIQVRNLCMSVDPYMRGRMVDRKSYVPPFQVGEALTGGAIGRIVKSAHPEYPEGEIVESHLGWREGFTVAAGQTRRIGELSAPPSAYLGVLGMPGMTAYVGLFGAASLKDKETVFVSGAAGAVGSIAGQIARIRGCRVVGSAGSADKVAWLTGELGFDHAFDYHDGRLLDHLREGAPDGLDVYFDNVGGDHLEAALFHMRPFGRIALCGAISQYNATEPVPGPSNLVMAIGLGLTLRGFIVSHFDHMADDFRRDMTAWVNAGEISYRETVYDGIDKAADAFIGLFTGANVGKMIVRLAD